MHLLVKATNIYKICYKSSISFLDHLSRDEKSQYCDAMDTQVSATQSVFEVSFS